MKKNNLLKLNKNILKKFMGAFLASVMTFGSAGQLITLASTISVQELTKDAWNNGSKYFNEGTDIKEKIKILNILLRSIGKEEISQEENDEDKIFQKVKNLSFEPNLNGNVADALKNIKEISPHAILEHNPKNSKYDDKKDKKLRKPKNTLFTKENITEIFSSIISVNKYKLYTKNDSTDKVNDNKKYLPSKENSNDEEYEYICETNQEVGENLKKLLIVTAPIRDNDGNMTGSEKIITMYPIEDNYNQKYENLKKITEYFELFEKHEKIFQYCEDIIEKSDNTNSVKFSKGILNNLNKFNLYFKNGISMSDVTNHKKMQQIKNYLSKPVINQIFKKIKKEKALESLQKNENETEKLLEIIQSTLKELVDSQIKLENSKKNQN